MVPRKTNASWDEKLARQMVLAMGLMTRKMNVLMAVLHKTNVFRFFVPASSFLVFKCFSMMFKKLKFFD